MAAVIYFLGQQRQRVVRREGKEKAREVGARTRLCSLGSGAESRQMGVDVLLDWAAVTR